ncbi:AAA-ATPase At3g28580-like [Salvia hispanica]|uniref:AAA-ATPase At3g28580-like n=1 Tax=Salvia hispanica TaxID=49212 RepID=UPI00200928A4|nr:AAA-ATPase At3g28580-like [Salvia hispanica]
MVGSFGSVRSIIVTFLFRYIQILTKRLSDQSIIATFVFCCNMIRQNCPKQLRRYIEKLTERLSGFLNPDIQVLIHEYAGSHLRHHEAYGLVAAYLSEKLPDAKRLKALMTNENKVMLSMEQYENTTDVFNGVEVKWISGKVPSRATGALYYPEPEQRYYKLKFDKCYKKMMTEDYLQHVFKRGREIRAANRPRRLYTNGKSTTWSYIVFEHPAKFATLAMEPEKKEEIVEDLLTFIKSKDYYARIGKAWKRGYLLYGPPGTGKSTMIAAMANLLSYDVYDLELTSVKDNTELRKLLIHTTAKSIIVIEDIDCSLNLTGQREKKEEKPAGEKPGKVEKKTSPCKEKNEKEESDSKVTLSGLLNFIDGLWSACAGERLIVFTTNHVDKLDPALTRRGRMDKHIELSYCKYEGFKVLAKNYLELEAHPLFQSIEELIQEVEISPADVAENLMPKSAKDGPEQSLRNLICILEETKNSKCTEVKDAEINHSAAAI